MTKKRGRLAQRLERPVYTRKVACSNHALPTTHEHTKTNVVKFVVTPSRFIYADISIWTCPCDLNVDPRVLASALADRDLMLVLGFMFSMK